jgi:hypothetical protein
LEWILTLISVIGGGSGEQLVTGVGSGVGSGVGIGVGAGVGAVALPPPHDTTTSATVRTALQLRNVGRRDLFI